MKLIKLHMCTKPHKQSKFTGVMIGVFYLTCGRWTVHTKKLRRYI